MCAKCCAGSKGWAGVMAVQGLPVGVSQVGNGELGSTGNS
jgi:hypothetical protein